MSRVSVAEKFLNDFFAECLSTYLHILLIYNGCLTIFIFFEWVIVVCAGLRILIFCLTCWSGPSPARHRIILQHDLNEVEISSSKAREKSVQDTRARQGLDVHTPSVFRRDPISCNVCFGLCYRRCVLFLTVAAISSLAFFFLMNVL